MTDIDKALLAAVAQALHGLRFGSLEIVVHEGRTVQTYFTLGTDRTAGCPRFHGD